MQVTSGYSPRVIDAQLDTLLGVFGGVLIEGPKWCGKTWTGRHHARSWVYADDPVVRLRADLDPRMVLAGQRPMLVDEWQDAPVLWDVARRMIDEDPAKGLFVFAGSASPADGAVRHSGTGRFARLRMRTMSLLETGDSTGSVALHELFDGATVAPQPSVLDYRGVIRLILRGGWPAGRGIADDAALLIPRQYVRSLAEFDLPRPDGTARNPAKVMALLRSLARHTATQASVATIRGDVVDHAEPAATIAMSTVWDYLDALRRVFAVDDLQPWIFALRSKTLMRKAPTHHLSDPSLAAAALGATSRSLHEDPNTTGLLFESLVVRDLRVYCDALGGSVFHYRDADGLEADAIVTDGQGAWGAVEVKLGSSDVDRAAATLVKLKSKLARETEPPAFLAVVTGTTGVAFTRDDGVHVIPIDCLGP
jgi:predicted AAA+ superfamily ATPase